LIHAPSVPSPSTPERVAAGLIGQLEAQVASVLRGKPEPIRLAVVCLLAKGHVLIEDVPGVGKTTLAQALARSLGVDFQRIQFTSDLLPSDILGVSIYRQERQAFEINRASPKTQSALLEAMSERQVSVDGQRLALSEPFIVIATQNPLEYVGTFPLPESQLDRFTMSLQLGYPPRVDERALLLSGGVEGAMADLKPAISRRELLQLQNWVDEVRVADKIVDYMLALAGGSRGGASEFLLGISTRALQGLYRAAQAMALCEGRSYVIPDDVQMLATPVLAHRVALKSGDDSPAAARAALQRLLAATPVPL
jgi:MoxR-like ATPase